MIRAHGTTTDVGGICSCDAPPYVAFCGCPPWQTGTYLFRSEPGSRGRRVVVPGCASEAEYLERYRRALLFVFGVPHG